MSNQCFYDLLCRGVTWKELFKKFIDNSRRLCLSIIHRNTLGIINQFSHSCAPNRASKLAALS